MRFITGCAALPIFFCAGLSANPLIDQLIGATTTFLEREVEAHLDRSAREARYDVQVNRLDPRLRLKHCEVPLAAYLAPGARTSGHTSVGVRCDGATPWTLFVPAIVRHEYSVVVAARPIARGEIVDAAALSSSTRLLPSAPTGLIGDPASAVGRAAVREIAAGTLLSSNLIKAAQTIKRGQSVTLSLASGAVAVRVAGTALRDGALGERIPVRNLNSKRVVEGVILDAGIVEVAAGRPIAARR